MGGRGASLSLHFKMDMDVHTNTAHCRVRARVGARTGIETLEESVSILSELPTPLAAVADAHPDADVDTKQCVPSLPSSDISAHLHCYCYNERSYHNHLLFFDCDLFTLILIWRDSESGYQRTEKDEEVIREMVEGALRRRVSVDEESLCLISDPRVRAVFISV